MRIVPGAVFDRRISQRDREGARGQVRHAVTMYFKVAFPTNSRYTIAGGRISSRLGTVERGGGVWNLFLGRSLFTTID